LSRWKGELPPVVEPGKQPMHVWAPEWEENLFAVKAWYSPRTRNRTPTYLEGCIPAVWCEAQLTWCNAPSRPECPIYTQHHDQTS
jgi:hypothetical protein